jgi:predicted lipoprotein with Yx(FWY)xxD motif
VLAALAAMTLSACGTAVERPSAADADVDVLPSPSDAVPPPASPGAAAAASPEPDLTEQLVAKRVAPLGTVVTDEDGWILYRFDGDKRQPPTSNCRDACEQTWPPAYTDGKPIVKGVKKSLVGTVTRADGTKQLTINNWPVYRYVGDTKPGEWRGQAVGGRWFAIAPSGKKVAGGGPAGGADATTAPGGGDGDEPTIPDPGGY